MSKQIVTKNAVPQVVKSGQKTIIKVAKGQHIAVQDLVQNQAKAAGDVVAIKQGQNLYMKFADGTELQFEDFYTECGGNACSVTVAGKEVEGYSINGDSGVGASTSDGGQLAYAYGDHSTLMSMTTGDIGITSALKRLGNGLVAYAPAGEAGTAWVPSGVLVALGGGLAALGVGGGGAGGGNVPPGDTTAPEAPTAIDVKDASDTGESITDNRSSDTTPAVRVTFNTAAVNGTAAKSGDTLKLFAGATQVGMVVLVDGDISAGFVDITPDNSLGVDNTYSLTAKITDAAGNTSGASSAVSYVLDSTAPTIQALVAHSADKTVVLTYSEALDSTNLPAVGDFTVTTAGVANPVASIAVSGATMTLTLTNAFVPGAVTVTYTATAGDQVNAIQDLAGNDDNNGFSSAIVADGYVRGATVYIDSNNNGVADPGVDYLVGTTDANGNFFIPGGAPSGTIIAVGGINIDTGVPNTTSLKAPAGSTTINPLTTLVQAVIVANPGTSTTDAANSVASALGITLPAGASLTSYDPISAGNLSAQQAAAQVVTVVALAESATGSTGAAGSTVITNIVTQIQSASSTGTTVSLSDASTLGAVLTGTNVTDAVQSAIADASTAIGSATSISDISAAQSQYLDTIAPATPVAADLVAASDAGLSNTDNITKNTGLIVRLSVNNAAIDGTAAVAGDTVILMDSGVQVGSATLSDGNITAGYVDIVLSGLVKGNHSFTGKVADQAGNLSDASLALAVTIDTAAPTLPTINTIAGNNAVNAAEKGTGITVSGAAEAEASVAVTWGGVTKTVTATGGNWSTSFAAGEIPDDGNTTLSATATDVAGNASAAGTRSVTIDATAPSAVVVISGANDNVTPTIGNITSGGTTNDNTLGLSGTVTNLGPGEVVVIYDGVTRLGTATVTGNSWTFTTPSLSNSAHNFTFRVEDEVGNQGTGSATYAVTVNATVPTATASILAVADNSGTVTNEVSNNGLTDDPAPTLSGTNSALATGEQIVIYDGGVRLGVATLSTATNWTFTPSNLSPGAHRFTAIVEANGGNQGTISTAFNITIDTTPPGAPIIGVIADDDVISSNEQAAVIFGTAEVNASIAISLGGNTRTVVADNSGNWSYTLTSADIAAMGQGSETLSIIATDLAGNVGSTETRNISVDTVAPDALVFNAVSTDDAINAAEKLLGVSITGTAEANAKIALTIGGAVRAITADGSGDWAYTLTTADYTAMGQGSETLSAIATDVVGNTSSAGTKTITIDTASPSLTAKLDPASDTGIANNDGKSNGLTPTLTGFSDTGAKIAVKEGTTTLGTTSADATTGAWSVTTSELTDGPHVLTISVIDAAGNSTARTVNYNLDTVAPTAKFNSATDNVGSVTGALTRGATTDDTSLVLEGSCELGSTVQVYNGSTELGLATVSGTSWSYTVTIANGTTYQFNVKETDAAGNTSEATTNFSVTGDTTAPIASLTQVTDDLGSVKGSLTSGSITDDGALVLSGSCEVGSTVQVYNGSTELGLATVSGTSWSFTATIANGTTYQFNVKETDAAGNTSDVTSNFTVTGDTASPSFTSGAVAEFAESGSGTAYASAVTDATTVTYTLGGTDEEFFNIDGSTGAVTFKAAPNFEASADDGADNVYDIMVMARDVAGNQSTRDVAITVTNVNEAPSITSGATASFAENGTGTAYKATATDPDAGSSLTYSLGGSDANLFNIDASTGVVTYKTAPNFEAPADNGADNVYEITVTATDNGTGTLSDTKAVVITVTNVNEAPVIASGATGSVAEKAATSTAIYTAQASDVDAGTVLTYSLSGADASLLDINSSTGVVTLKASANFEVKSSYSFNVIATDNGTGSLSDTEAVTVSVTDVNEAPTAVGTVAAQTAVNGQAFSLDVHTYFADVDAGSNGTLSYSATGLPTGITIDSSTGVISGTASADRSPASVTVTATDGGSLFTTQSFDLGVVSAPTITGLAANVAVANSGDALVFTVTVSEAVTVNTSGGTPTLTLDVGGQTLTATYSGGSGTTSLIFTATAGAGDDSTVSVTAINLNGGSITGDTTGQGLLTTATGQVVPSFIVDNTNPSFTSGAVAEFAESGSGTAYASAVTDATTVTYTLGGTDEEFFNIDGSTGAVTFKAAPNFEASADDGADNVYDIMVMARDVAGNQSTRDVAITVTNVNEAPSITSGATASFAENGTGTAYKAAATDPDAGSSLTYSLGGSDANLFSIDASTGVVTYKTAPNFEAPADNGADNVYEITVTATDNGTGTLSDTKAVVITVTNVNEAPVIASGATGSVAEKAATSTAIYTAQASDVDAGTVLTYSLSGADASLLDINSSTGVVTLKASANFEVKSSYSFNVIATDNGTGSPSDTEAVTVSVTDVNEAPTAVGTVAAQTAVNGQAFSLDVHTYFADVDAGSNGTLSYSATGLPTGITIDSSTGVISGTASADRSPASVTVTATDGGSLFITQSFDLGVASAPVLQSSNLDNVDNLDVTSTIVLNYGQSVTAAAGKYIHIVNAGGIGFRGDVTVHTQDILVTDTSQVTISGGKIMINPAFDLDLANNYYVTIDEGAFTSSMTGLVTAAFDGTSSLNFSTVTPGTLSIVNAVASQVMDANGDMVASYKWLDIEGIGSPSAASGTPLDLGGGNYALVAKDYDASGGDSTSGYDGIQLGDLYVAVNNFALGDLLYIDDQVNNLNALNDLTLTAVLDLGTPPTTIQFAGTSLGGFIDIALYSSLTTFDSVDAFNTAIGGSAVLVA